MMSGEVKVTADISKGKGEQVSKRQLNKERGRDWKFEKSRKNLKGRKEKGKRTLTTAPLILIFVVCLGLISLCSGGSITITFKRFSWKSYVDKTEYFLVRYGVKSEEKTTRETTVQPLVLPALNDSMPSSQNVKPVIDRSVGEKLLAFQKSRIWYQYIQDVKFLKDMKEYAIYAEKNITGIHVTNKGTTSYHGPKTFHQKKEPFAVKAMNYAKDFIKKAVMTEANKKYNFGKGMHEVEALLYEEISVTCDHAWVNVNKGPARNMWHAHPSSDISVVFYISTTPGSTIRFQENHDKYKQPLIGSVVVDPGLMVAFPSFLFHDVPPTQTFMRRISYAFDFKVKFPRRRFRRRNFPMNVLTVNGIDQLDDNSKRTFAVEEFVNMNQNHSVSRFGSFNIGQAIMHNSHPISPSRVFDDLRCTEDDINLHKKKLNAKRFSKPASWPPHSLVPPSTVVDTNNAYILERCSRQFQFERNFKSNNINLGELAKLVQFLKNGILMNFQSMLPKLNQFVNDSFVHTYIKKELLKGDFFSADLSLDDIQIIKIEKVSVNTESESINTNSERNITEPGVVDLDSIPFTYEEQNSDKEGGAGVCGCEAMVVRGIISIDKESSSKPSALKVCGVVFEDRRSLYKPFYRAIGKQNSFGNYFFPRTYDYGRFILPMTHDEMDEGRETNIQLHSLTTLASRDLHNSISKIVIGNGRANTASENVCSFGIVEACVKMKQRKKSPSCR